MRRRHRHLSEPDQSHVVRARLARLRMPTQTRPDIGGWVPDVPERRGPAAPRAGPVDEPPGKLRPRFAGRWELGRLHVVVVAAALLIGLGGAGLVYASNRPDVEPITPVTEATGTPMTDAATGRPSRSGDRDEPSKIVVHVAGLVKRPGIVSLPAGSRVIDAVKAAGGATSKADLNVLNLARPVGDGEQIVVGTDPPPDTTSAPSADEPAPVNLNTASIEQLEALPGIGPEIGRRIIEWRETYGGFTVVDELQEVSGIGESTLAELKPLVTV